LAKFFGKTEMPQQWQPLEHGIMMDRHRQVIGVTGIGRGAGATFTAMGLALQMAEMTEGVTFAEGKLQADGEHSAGRLLAVDRRFDKRTGARTNIYHKVNWAFCEPDMQEKAEPDYRSLPGKHIIIDSPQNIDDMDLIVCVVDPLPSRIMAGLETFRRIKEQTLVPVIWVMNRSSSAVSRREVETFLRTKFTHAIPLIPAEIFYKAEFSCTQPLLKPGMAGAGEAFTALAGEILVHKQ